MKYKRAWQQQVSGLPDKLRARCIDYAAWKKTSKDGVDPRAARPLLVAECRGVDATFRDAFARRQMEMLLTFALVNRTTVTKLCKRIDRRNADAGMREWFSRELRPSLRFCGGAEVRRLELDAGRVHAPECPVCLEEVRPFVIMDCGHCVCLPCFEAMHGISGMRGTLQNRLASSRWHAGGGTCPRCPECRRPHPVLRVRSWCVVVAPEAVAERQGRFAWAMSWLELLCLCGL